MPSSEKLIKQGIKYTDSLFNEISKRLEQGVKSSDTLEAFLDATSEYTAKNPLISSGYDETMLRLILQETNNHKFSRPSQKELARVTIENYVGDLIVDVGEDVKDSVREIVRDGYNNNLSQDEIASNISERVSVIKNKRARAIARTEIARTATVSDYIINKERGATHWYVECRNTACPVCKHAWHEGWTEENDANFTPSDSSAGGKGWIGDKVYPMSDTSSLPPIHPNCRCVVYFVNEEDMPEKGVIQDTPVKQQTTVQKPTNSITDKLNDDELERYIKFQKDLDKANKMLNKLADDDPRRIMFESRIKQAKIGIKKLEDIASNSDNRRVVEEHILHKGGKKNTHLDYDTINTHEDIASYFGLTYIDETTTQYGKTTHRHMFYDEKYNVYIRGIDNFDINETKEVLRSYDKANPLLKSAPLSIHLDPTTNIRDLGIYEPGPNAVTIYSHKRDTSVATLEYTTNHELTHAFDNLLSSNFDKFFSQESKEYRKLVREEGWSSAYSHSVKGSTRIAEDMAETGALVLNKDNPNIRITMPDGTILTAKEWCKQFPKKTAYFEKLLKSKEAKSILQ